MFYLCKVFDLGKIFTLSEILLHKLFDLSKISRAHFSIKARKILDFWQILS